MLVVAPAGDLVTRNLILLRAASRWGESTGLWVDTPSLAKTLTTSEQVNTHTQSKSQQGKKTRYIQMVQTHGLIQLSLGAALINRVIDVDSKFLLQLTPDFDGKPSDPMQTLVRGIFSMIEVNDRKVWICLTRGSNGSYTTGYFSSVMESINVHITNFVACPGAQVY
jgi:hypothetical protein